MIHLRTPPAASYNRDNPLRIESAAEAREIDERINQAWHAHPRRIVIDPEDDFLGKAAKALDALRTELPTCCRDYVLPSCAGHTRTVLPVAPGLTLPLNG